MGIGVGTLLASSWRANLFAPAVVEVVPANYGAAGSRPQWRNRRTDTILAPTAGADPRAHRYNGLIPVVWRLRSVDAAKMAAVAAQAPRSLGAPVSFTPPRTASLLAKNAGGIDQ